MLINLEGEEKKSPVQKKTTNQLNQPPQEFLNKCKALKPTGYRKNMYISKHLQQLLLLA